MARFRYAAYDSHGNRIEKTREHSTAESLEEALKRENLTLISIETMAEHRDSVSRKPAASLERGPRTPVDKISSPATA